MNNFPETQKAEKVTHIKKHSISLCGLCFTYYNI